MKKKYQIFVSSTYKDLTLARQKVIEAILRMYHIPIGMEMFSAGDDEQWEIIRDSINLSDYYVLIIGFKYGSLTPEGISYTEKEYDYAIEQGVPVLAFIQDRNITIATDNRDTDSSKLNKFIAKVKGKTRDTWTNVDELSSKVTSALYK